MTSQANVTTVSPSSSREISVLGTLPWYPQQLHGRISLPERRRHGYTVLYPDYAVLDPRIDGSAKDAIHTTLHWYPRQFSSPEKAGCKHTVCYPDYAFLGPRVNDGAKDAPCTDAHLLNADIPVDGECACLQQSAGNENSSEEQIGKYAVSRPGHAKLDPYNGEADSSGQGKIIANSLAPLIILGLTMGFFVGVKLMKRQV